MAKTSSLSELSATERRGLSSRIREMVDAAGGQQAAAAMAGVSIRQLAAYTAGESAPPFVPVARLAEGTGFDLNWVLRGVGSGRAGREQPQGEQVRDTLRYAQRTKLKVHTAETIGKAVERVHSVVELPEQVDDAIGDLAEAVVDASGSDETARQRLTDLAIALVRATHDIG